MAQLISPAQRQSRTFMNWSIHKNLNLPITPPRPIDFVVGQREIPMQVICLGLSRTGSFSIFTALGMLGYAPYHMGEAMLDAPVALPCLQQAIEAKYFGTSQPWGKKEFDKLLGRYDALVEIPSNILAEEFLEAYPDALVIIHDRPVEGWLKSMENSITAAISWKIWPWIAWADPIIVGPWWNLFRVIDKVQHLSDCRYNPAAATDFYNKHYALMRSLCANRKNVLEFRPQHGWEPLCEFLGKPVPETPFPNLNDTPVFIGIHKDFVWRGIREAVKKVLGGGVVVAVLAVVGWRSRGATEEVLRAVQRAVQGRLM